jgi:acid phosphatase (class A)
MRNGARRIVPGVVIVMMLALCGAVKETYVLPSEFDFKALLSPPPAVGSDQSNKEIDQLLALQAKRTDADVKRIKIESKMTGFIFSQSVGSWFDRDDLPETAVLLDKTLVDSKEICKSAKAVFRRRRPYIIDNRIKPCEMEDNFSYPSSHSTRAVVLALTVAQIFPDKKDALMAQANEIGDDRALAGQHYPSDVEAGRTLGKAIFEKMMLNPQFLDDLAAAKKECAEKEPVAK